MRHPDHDAIAAEVRSWYLTAHPDMGYTAEPRWFGVVRTQPDSGFASATVTDLAPSDVERFVAELRRTFPDRDALVQVVRPAASAPGLHDALIHAGLERESETTYLVHTGEPPTGPPPAGFAFEPIDRAGIDEFSSIKLRGFASSEDDPSAADLARERGHRLAELGDPNGFAIGRLHGEGAGIVAWYGGGDALIFLVATRAPFRRRGLATAMIGEVLRLERARGTRSVLINADVDDDPVRLYQRLGFVDEVHREWRYRLPA